MIKEPAVVEFDASPMSITAIRHRNKTTYFVDIAPSLEPAKTTTTRTATIDSMSGNHAIDG